MLVLVDQVDQGMAVVCVGRSVGGVGVGSCRLGWCRSNSRQVGFRFGWVGRLGMVTVGLLSLGSGQVGLGGRSGLASSGLQQCRLFGWCRLVGLVGGCRGCNLACRLFLDRVGALCVGWLG